jgi:single-strand DNA-binding protein
MYMNQLTIIGFTGQDAELHYTQNGTPVTTLSVATKESWKNDQGEWQSRTEWHRVVAFGKLAEYAKTLPKGSHLLVQGPLRSREYEKDGLKLRVTELRADSIGKLDRAVRREDGDARPERVRASTGVRWSSAGLPISRYRRDHINHSCVNEGETRSARPSHPAFRLSRSCLALGTDLLWLSSKAGRLLVPGRSRVPESENTRGLQPQRWNREALEFA